MNTAQEDKVKKYMDSTGQRKVLLVLNGQYYLASVPVNCSETEMYRYVSIERLPMPIQIVGLEDVYE